MSTPMLANVSAQLGLNAPGQNPLLPFPVPSQPPVLLAAVPVSGPTTGGNAVLLIGLGLDNVTSVSFGGTPAVVISQNLLGLLVAVSAPAHAAGTVPVTVTTPVGTSNAVNYTYVSPVLPPTVTAITPVSGPVTGGTSFTITGTNLTGATVLFGGLPATGVSVAPSGNSLTGVTPFGLGAGNATVTVITPAGTANVPGGFTYTAGPPTTVTIIPNTGPATGGTPFVIAGTGLSGGSVTIGGIPATGVTTDPTGTLLFGTTPAGALGNQPVVVTTPGGSATVPGGFTYV
ncbi:IPT/TIG domain-containing protein [Streptomyces sp. NBC_01187]|uniref:IPT/TIG domain-containing protein n=1 Tax=Streptomyces sp. NBC_01187 TaxID=2903766 RepID=UPI0038672655|nr:IPT/TIG domain-containing protein [Streptomyces sp. NBC_01187]WSS46917.1 IPT/TIG domain-containing protein [Streptomyces sp. NBC_01187]